MDIFPRWFLRFAAVLAAIFVLSVHPAPGANTPVADFYVATNGNDSSSGKLAAPNAAATDGPFATLERARDTIRALKVPNGLKAPVTVMVRGGKYFLEKTIVFSVEDSGSRDDPVTYEAYPGERPVVSGGRRVQDWKPYRGKILMAELPGAKGGKWKFRQLFENGRRQIRARWPNFEPKDPMYGGWAFMEGPAEPGSLTAFQYRVGTFPRRWAKPGEGEVEFYGGTGQWRSTVAIKSVNESHRIIRLAHPGMQFDVSPWYMPVPFAANNPFYVVNLLEELDQPGEWCLVSEEGRLYFWPPSGSLTSTDEVVVPALRTLIDISGASWLRLYGLTFTETMDGDNSQHFGVRGAGAMFAQPTLQYGGDALHMKDAAHCTIERNRFEAVGCNAIYLEGYNFRNEIRRNEIAHAGANGICLLGTVEKHPMFNRVEDNEIHHVGELNKYVAGIFLGMSNGNIVGHNRIEYVPHHAINLSNNPGGRNIIEYNLIRHACLEIMDTGAINSWMEQPASKDAERDGHVIRFNYIADAYAFVAADGKVGKVESEFTNGIYLDNYTSNCLVFGNIIVRCRNGIMIHAGKNNLIENNILVNCWANFWIIDAVSGASPYWKNMAGFMTGNFLGHNIFYQTRADAVYMFIHNGWTEQTFAESD
ncbi:MAG: right-handed parallel beta-helix repeat-containing protein, partial [Acidobacteriia bacterium]|nr:right-handed parallel beta-helix repeat-containing protein [Terriglobia bacterium]